MRALRRRNKIEIKTGECIQLQDKSMLAIKSRLYMDVTGQAVQTELQSNKMNREGALSLSKSQKPHVYCLKECRKPHS
jgi:hypothetical protein